MSKRRPPAGPRAAKAPAPGLREPTYDDLLAIVRLVESGSRFREFRLRSGDIEVEVLRPDGAAREGGGDGTVASALRNGDRSDSGAKAAAPGAGGSLPAKAGTGLPDLPPGTRVIRSPMVGTFYRAPDPASAPFVEPGSRVEPDTIVCIIEVMKLMNSVPAGVPGIVTQVFAENAQMVEYGQALLAIRTGP